MLNLISDFLPSETETQFFNEQFAVIKLHKTLQSNLLFFKHFNNDIYLKICNYQAGRYAVFCTKDEELNIVETASGRVLYGDNPNNEALAEVNSFCKSAPTIWLDNASINSKLQKIEPEAVILMFGIGSGLQLLPLIQQALPSVLVIYEPELDLFVSSLNIIDWASVFATAGHNTQISIQLNNDGSTIAADLRELDALIPSLKKVYLYRHLSHSVSDEVFQYLNNHSGQREKLLNHSRQFIGYCEDQLFIHERAPGILANEDFKDAKKDEIFSQNMQALNQYYPYLYKIFVDYQPTHWRCVLVNNQHNLYCEERSVFFYHDVHQDSSNIIQRFLKKPLENELILNQGGIEKFKSYVHFNALKKLQPILTKLKPRSLDNITNLENLIILGVGLGGHIEMLLKEIQVKNLFIFEPNIDYFYASLFVTDWARLFKDAADTHKRFYFNIGGSGDEYFSDIMGQFYQTGAYAIANSLIYPAFLTPGMRVALSKLQSQLAIIVAMGENFDHVRYGIAHTHHSFCQNHGLLTKKNIISPGILIDVPVFIVGNGPSLDQSFQYIIDNRKNVIVISCGTALKSLYRLGIKPDFHAEIEQNGSTFSWISQVGDDEWLKSISLLSINGVHPKTAALFKDVWLALKEGESSTNFFRDILKKRNIETETLKLSYPTVANLVLDILTLLGFKELYLMGVDLGYVDPQNHHSRYSAYYNENDKAIEKADVGFSNGLAVKGNFRQVVYTKAEFDFSRSIIEMCIKSHGKKINVYNCSDGAYIAGSFPLRPENIIFKNVDFDLQNALQSFFIKHFKCYDLKLYVDEIEQELAASNFNELVSLMISNIVTVNCNSEAELLISEQWNMLVENYYTNNKLGFYLLCGSTLYMLTILTRLLPIKEKNADYSDFNEACEIWVEYLNNASKAFDENPFEFCGVDVSYYFKE